MANFHPWMVESIEAFSFYCCPECTFRSKEENFFEAHALQNHDSSRYFFQENAEMKMGIKVEAFEESFEVTPDDIGQHFLSNTNVKVNPKKEQKGELEDFIDDEDASEDFSDEEDKAIARRNSKVKRKPRGMSNKMINEQKEQISTEGIKTTDSGDCPICGEYFKLLKNHIENMHSTVDAFKCNLCDYSHSTNWGLKQHINNNHGNRNGRAGKCNLCGNFFKYLGSHMKRVHNEGAVNASKYPTSELDQNGENEMQSMKNSGSDAEIVEEWTSGPAKTGPGWTWSESENRMIWSVRAGGTARPEKLPEYKNPKAKKDESLGKSEDGTKEHISSEAYNIKWGQSGDCPICGEYFKTLKTHFENKHSTVSAFKCTLCDYSHSRKWGLKQHIKNNHGDRNGRAGKCHICGNFFKFLPTHMKSVHNDEPMENFETDPIGENDEMIQPHQIKVELELEQDAVTNQLAVLNKGKKYPEKTTADGQPIEITITTFICPICSKELTTRSNKKFYKRECLKTHILAEHTDSDLKFVNEMFPPKNKRSEKGVHREKGGICPHCGEYKHQLLQHIEYVHATEKIFKCDQCDYAHASQHGLNGHKKYNHPTENDLKVCHICGYKNPSQHNVNKHIQSVHEGQRNHPCNICGHRFVSKHRMEVHVRSIHLGEKNYKCKVCAEAFKCASELSEHRKKIHEGVKYECDQCNKEFRGGKELKRHILNIHEGIRFNCDLCSKQFQSETDVRRHKNKAHQVETMKDLAHTTRWKRFPHPADPVETPTGNTLTGSAITGNAIIRNATTGDVLTGRVNQVCPISNPYPEGRIYKKEDTVRSREGGPKLWRKDYYDK